ncbi:MAG: hypothetical protein QOG62_2442, partial [Thermoleophilaceae bacterium]|nr:hypothetical protein [Thermoleophilaceae bacterium]
MRASGAFISGLAMSVLCALAPAAASASTQIGQTMFPSTAPIADMNCLKETVPMFDTSTMIQFQRQAGSLPSYTVPAGGGVVTSWAHMAPSPVGFAESIALKMLRPAGGTQFKVVGTSDVQTLPSDGFHSFSTRIPVQAGDVLGLYVQHQGNIAYCQEATNLDNAGDKTREIDGTQNAAVGTTLDFAANEQAARLSVAAVIEPDVDGDGLGDETQDSSVPGNANVDTAAPDTTVTGKRKVKTKKKTGSGKFTFSSDDSGATFMCRLDAKPFADCTSPRTVKARLGTHVFTVV